MNLDTQEKIMVEIHCPHCRRLVCRKDYVRICFPVVEVCISFETRRFLSVTCACGRRVKIHRGVSEIK